MGVSAERTRAGLLGLCLLLLLSPLTVRATDAEARDLTGDCAFVWSAAQERAFALTDGRIDTSCRMQPGDELRLEAPEDMGTLLLRCYMQDVVFSLTEMDERGSLLRERQLTAAVLLTVPLTTGCREVRIGAMDGGLRLCELMVFSPGSLPGDVPHPEPPLDKADFLLVSTHPDDEWVFLGGVYPIYGGERGLSGTVVYVTLPTWERAQEAVNGLWIGGVRTHPFFLGFPDVRQSAPRREKNTFRVQEVTLALVRLYRRIRPLVVVTQDPVNGEYGHWQHKLSAQAAFDAVQLAADPACDPESAEAYGTWTVLKLYQHFAQGISSLELDVNAPLASYGGLTALEVANAAFEAHRTQLKTPYRPENAQDPLKGDIVHFGLTWSVVGPDTAGDLFEHIPAEALAGYVPPTPTPEPTATPAPSGKGEGSRAPTEGPTATAAARPTSTPTASPDPRAWDRAEAGAAWAADRAEVIAACIVGALALILLLRQVGRVRHRRRRSLFPEPPAGEDESEGEAP